jgi:hypothetical protein
MRSEDERPDALFPLGKRDVEKTLYAQAPVVDVGTTVPEGERRRASRSDPKPS